MKKEELERAKQIAQMSGVKIKFVTPEEIEEHLRLHYSELDEATVKRRATMLWYAGFGWYDWLNKEIRLSPRADYKTFLHEFGHFLGYPEEEAAEKMGRITAKRIRRYLKKIA